MNDEQKNDLMDTLLKANQEREAEYQRQKLEQEKHENEQERFHRILNDQKSRLVSILKEVIDEFNSRSSTGEIDVTSMGDVIRYSLPHHREEIPLKFISLRRQLSLTNINRGTVPLAAYIQGSGGTGRNFLWSQANANDSEGRWIVCRINTSAIARSRPDLKRHGIIYGFETEEALYEIERSISAMNIYEVGFEDNVQHEFMQILLDTMKHN